jgi:hypothetical protein
MRAAIINPTDPMSLSRDRVLLPVVPLFLFLFNGIVANAQKPFYDYGTIDINNIKASNGVHGDLWHWWSLNHNIRAGAEYPRGSGINMAFAGALWMGGYDSLGQLRCAAAAYRLTAQEYWPGPLQASGLDYTTSGNWARTWKVDIYDLKVFASLCNKSPENIPAAILEWPAKGNVYAKGRNNASLIITEEMAPFIDVNGDDIYNALQGDYPDIKGDQMLWFVFSDNGISPHDEITGTLPTGIEVKASVYGYEDTGALGNTLFYEFELRNAGQSLDSFTAGVFADFDLGCGLETIWVLILLLTWRLCTMRLM